MLPVGTRCHVLAAESPHPADPPVRVDTGLFGPVRPAATGVVIGRVGDVVMVELDGTGRLVFRHKCQVVPHFTLKL